MKIGELAKRAGAKTETIRFYERLGLLPPPARTSGNYRDYDHWHVSRLAFIRHARSLGFDLEDIKALLALSDEPQTDCAQADRIASKHLTAVEAKIEQLQRLKSELNSLVTQCRGGRVEQCRIIEALSDHEACGPDHRSGVTPPLD
jgi:Cu(I)-responsive transcriptional regulator